MKYTSLSKDTFGFLNWVISVTLAFLFPVPWADEMFCPQARQPEFNIWTLCGRMRESVPISCPLTSTHIYTHAPPTHTLNNQANKYFKYLMAITRLQKDMLCVGSELLVLDC